MKAPATLPFFVRLRRDTARQFSAGRQHFIKKAEWDTFENQQEYNDFMARAFWEAERILKPNGTLALSLSNKAPATTKRGWHGLRKQKAPFALDCKRK